MKFPIGSLLFDSNSRGAYFIVVDDDFDDDGEEGCCVNLAYRSIKKWDASSTRLHQIMARPLLKHDGTWVFSDTILTPEEFSFCQRIA
jgi:hypothetical protein